MNRPLFWIGTSYFWTLMLLMMTGEKFAVALAAGTGFFGVLSTVLVARFGGGKRSGGANRPGGAAPAGQWLVPAVCFFCMLAALLFIVKSEREYKPAMALDGTTGHMEGYVSEVLTDSESGSHRCVISAEVEGADVPGRLKIRFSSKTYTPKVNDWISVDATFYALGGDDEEMRGYFKSRQMYLGAYTFEKIRAGNLSDAPVSRALLLRRQLYGKVTALRNSLLETVRDAVAEPYSAVLNGMLLGDKSRIAEEEQTAFKKAGILPLFAVSGFHMALWGMMFWRFLLRAGLGQKRAGVFAIAFVLLFMALTGFSGSCIRAGLMLILLFLGRMTAMKADSLNSLGAAVFLMTVGNPFAGGDSGVLLSFFATLGILTVFPSLMKPVRRKLKRIGNHSVRVRVDKAVSVLLISASTLVTTLPVVMLTFGSVSLMSPVSNLLVTVPASGAILLTGFSALGAHIPVAGLLSRWGFLASGLMARYMLFVCRKLAALPFSYVGIGSGGFRAAVSACLLLTAAVLLLRPGRDETELPVPVGKGAGHPAEEHQVQARRMAVRPAQAQSAAARTVPARAAAVRTTALFCAVLLLSSVFSEELLNRKKATVTFASVGNGSCVVVCYDGSAAVIGAGGDYRVKGQIDSIMQENGASRMSALIIPRASEGESSSFAKVAEQYAPQTVIVPDGFDVSAAAGSENIVRAGDAEVTLFPEVTLRLHAGGTSPAALLTVDGLRILLVFLPSASPASLNDVFGNTAFSSDILYCRAGIPEGLNCTGFSYIIVSTQKEEVPAIGSIRPLTTSPQGLSAGCKNGRYRIGRRSS